VYSYKHLNQELSDNPISLFRDSLFYQLIIIVISSHRKNIFIIKIHFEQWQVHNRKDLDKNITYCE